MELDVVHNAALCSCWISSAPIRAAVSSVFRRVGNLEKKTKPFVAAAQVSGLGRQLERGWV